MRKPLVEIQWMATFKVSWLPDVLTKSALRSGSKIGAYTPGGNLFFFEPDVEVIEVK